MVMENKPIDIVTDVVIPALVIAVIFIINGIILFFIFKKRKTIVYEDVGDYDAPTTSPNQNADNEAAGCDIELQRL